MTSRIIVAIFAVFAVVLSLAAPVDVDAQPADVQVSAGSDPGEREQNRPH